MASEELKRAAEEWAVRVLEEESDEALRERLVNHTRRHLSEGSPDYVEWVLSEALSQALPLGIKHEVVWTTELGLEPGTIRVILVRRAPPFRADEKTPMVGWFPTFFSMLGLG